MDKEEETAFMQVFPIVLGALIAFTVVIFIVARFIAPSALEMGKANDPRVQALVAERIRPVGQVRSELPKETVSVAVAAEPMSGEAAYTKVCAACHDSGAVGAPKKGDAGDWQARSSKGIDGLLKSAIAGLGMMPPRGGSKLSDAELRAAIEHMLPQ